MAIKVKLYLWLLHIFAVFAKMLVGEILIAIARHAGFKYRPRPHSGKNQQLIQEKTLEQKRPILSKYFLQQMSQ